MASPVPVPIERLAKTKHLGYGDAIIAESPGDIISV
jgi:hypothetical protein